MTLNIHSRHPGHAEGGAIACNESCTVSTVEECREQVRWFLGSKIV